MIRAFLYLLVVAALAFAASWLADLPGSFELTMAGYRFEMSLLVALVLLLVVVGLVMVLYWLIAWIFRSPAAVSGFFRSRRRDKGYRALSRGMIAAAAGDVRLAKHYGAEARRLAPRESLSLLLAAQAAQLGGDRAAARKAFEAMVERPDTEILGLRGLYIEASREGDHAAARQYAERAARAAPSLPWAGNALLDYQTREHDWDEALSTVKRNADARLIDRKTASRQRAVLLTAKAEELEETEQDRALALALEAHKLAPDLVPAAVIAGRLSAAAGNTRQATKVVERAWKEHPHPDLAEVYAHARQGDSARDRLKRVRALADKRPHESEGAMAVAVAAIEARDWAVAREALKPLLRERPTRRACMLMAEIEEGESGDAGRVREWLGRALRAPRDPAWVADGYVSDEWQPVSPVTGEIDAFEWRTPPELLSATVDEPEDEPMPALAGRSTPEPADEDVQPTVTAAPVAPAPAAPKAEARRAPDTAAQPKADAPVAAAPASPAKPASAEAGPGKAEAGKDDAGTSDAGRSDAGKGDAGKGDTGKSDTSQSDAGKTVAGATGAGAAGTVAAGGTKAESARPAPTPDAASAAAKQTAPVTQAAPAASAQPKPASGAAAAGAAAATTVAQPSATEPAKPATPAAPKADAGATAGAKPAASRPGAAGPKGQSSPGEDDDDLPRPPDDPGPDGLDDPDVPTRRVPVL